MTRLISACAAALALVSSPGFAQLRADLIVSGLSQPVAFVQDPSQPDVQLIVEQGGHIRVLKGGTLLAGDFLDLSGQVLFAGEQGLLGLAFAPDYATSGRLFVNFVNLAGHTVIARFRRSAASQLSADPASRFNLVWPDGNAFITQPFSNHKGGDLMFGPDGYLYIGMGDGGSGNDPGHRAQNPLTLLGKFLRIDVSVPDSDPQGYDVPADNPFVGRPGVLPEIWAFGVRNPWRFSFDDVSRGGTGALVIADVGQSSWEEIDYEPTGRGGRNYGWRNREGAHDYVTTLPPFSTPLTDPIFEYSHTVGQSITGGFVYRGVALGASYYGRYFFADFVAGRIWSLGLAIDPASREAVAAGLLEHTTGLGSAATMPSAFGVDARGELYVVSYSPGAVYRIDSTANVCASPDPFVVMGGGTCVNGGWLPPGMAPPGVPPSSPPSPPPPTTGGCSTPDPFVGLPGLIGSCVNGGWLPVAGVSTTGTVHFYPLEGGFWAIQADDGTIYDPMAGVAPAFQIDGLRVSFSGRLRPDLMSFHMVGPIIEIVQIRVE
jgi:glucose/arabinose dehydrogenase